MPSAYGGLNMISEAQVNVNKSLHFALAAAHHGAWWQVQATPTKWQAPELGTQLHSLHFCRHNNVEAKFVASVVQGLNPITQLAISYVVTYRGVLIWGAAPITW